MKKMINDVSQNWKKKLMRGEVDDKVINKEEK